MARFARTSTTARVRCARTSTTARRRTRWLRCEERQRGATKPPGGTPRPVVEVRRAPARSHETTTRASRSQLRRARLVGAVVVADDPVRVGARPLVAGGVDPLVGPAAVGLCAVMSPAQRRDVVSSTWWWAVRSLTGVTLTWPAVPHHSRICSTVTGVRVVAQRPTLPTPASASSARCTLSTSSDPGTATQLADPVRVARWVSTAKCLRSAAARRLASAVSGVVAGQGFVDEVVELGPGAGVGDVGDAAVDLRGPGGRQRLGLLGDPEGSPHRHLPVEDALPQPRKPVAQLEGGADVGLAGVGGRARGLRSPVGCDFRGQPWGFRGSLRSHLNHRTWLGPWGPRRTC